jgi:hypothetical protein
MTVNVNDQIATPLADDPNYFQILIDPRTTTAKAEDVHISFTANKMSRTGTEILGISWLTGGGENHDDWTQPKMNVVNSSTGVTLYGTGDIPNLTIVDFNSTYDVTLDKLPVDPTTNCYILKIPFLDPEDSTKSLAGSGHLTITLNAAAVMQINSNADGTYAFALPSPAVNGAGSTNHWDFVEFNCATPASNGKSVCFCNTTNVDFFSMGMTIKGRDAAGDIKTFGIDLNTKDPVTTLLTNLKALPAEYTAGYSKPNGTYVRYMAPDLSFSSNATALDTAITDGYNHYKKNTLKFTVSGNEYEATTSKDGNTLNFTKPKTFSIGKPSTLNVISSTGPLDTGTTSDPEIQGAMKFIDAALNRGIFTDTSKWSTPTDYYPTGVEFNQYSNCLHNAFIDKACYGFSYDDVPGDGVLSVPAIGTCTSMTLVISDS